MRVKLLVAFIMSLLVLSIPLIHAEALSYDANGNLVTGDGKFRIYNSLNQLSKIYNGSSDAGILLEEFTYHPTEERILTKKTYNSSGSVIETVIYVDENFVRVVNASGSYDFMYVKHEGQLVGQLNPDGSKLFIHTDQEGSSTVVTNEAQTVVENTTYSPFGEVLTGGSEVRYGYEGKEHDTVVGDTDFNFRKYKPEWGIYLIPDNLLPNVYDPQQLNRYAFENNNPYKNVDPTGHDGGASLAVVAYIAWKVWGAFLSLVPVGQYIHDPSSISTTQLKGAVADAGLSLVPISGDIQTAINTVYFAADPLEYLTNPDYPVSPGTKIVKALSKEEEKKNREKEKNKVTPPTKITDQSQKPTPKNQEQQGQNTGSSGSRSSARDRGQSSALLRFWNKITTYFTKPTRRI